MRPFETQNNFTEMKQKAGLLPSPQPQTKGVRLRETEMQEDTQMEGFMRHG